MVNTNTLYRIFVLILQSSMASEVLAFIVTRPNFNAATGTELYGRAFLMGEIPPEISASALGHCSASLIARPERLVSDHFLALPQNL